MITADDLQGHWRRDWIRAPGYEDRSTQVHWMQAGALFADIRIPADRPASGDARCLAQMPQPAIAALLRAEGFAGTIDVTESRCTWHRTINWHGQPGQPDIGAMSVDTDGHLIEDGVHADYRELWIAQESPPLRGHAIGSGKLSGVLIESDTTFLLAIGPVPEGHTEGLRDALASSTADRDTVEVQFAGTYAFGHWDGPVGRAALCTDPFQEGMPVLERGDGFVWQSSGVDGTKTARPLTLL